MTSARFQTVAIYLAAIGLILSRGEHPSSLTAVLILVVSVGLWILDLRNRDILYRLGERGSIIEQTWNRRTHDASSQRGSRPREGHVGFFLDSNVPPRLRFLTLQPVTLPTPISPWLLTHAFGIDVVFLGVIGYAIALLAHAHEWPSILIALIPLAVGGLLAILINVLRKRAMN